MKNYVMRFGSGDSRNFSGLSPTFLIFVRSDTGATVTPPSISEIAASWGLYTFQWGTTTPIAFLADGATSGLTSANRYITGALDAADRADEYGTTMVALGNTLIFNAPANMGATIVAIGNTAIALGSTAVAIGTAQGTTVVAIGNTSIALGSSIYALEQNLGTTLVAIGNTSIAIGTSLFVGNASLIVSVAGIGTIGSTFGGVGSDPIDLFGYLKRLQENLEGNETFTKLSGALQIYSRGSSTLLITKTIANSSSTVTKT